MANAKQIVYCAAKSLNIKPCLWSIPSAEFHIAKFKWTLYKVQKRKQVHSHLVHSYCYFTLSSELKMVTGAGGCSGYQNCTWELLSGWPAASIESVLFERHVYWLSVLWWWNCHDKRVTMCHWWNSMFTYMVHKMKPCMSYCMYFVPWWRLLTAFMMSSWLLYWYQMGVLPSLSLFLIVVEALSLRINLCPTGMILPVFPAIVPLWNDLVAFVPVHVCLPSVLGESVTALWSCRIVWNAVQWFWQHLKLSICQNWTIRGISEASQLGLCRCLAKPSGT